MTTTLENIPLDKIYPTPDNKRRIDLKSDSFLELVESIRAKGQKDPGIARPHPEYDGCFDLRGGRRRLEALKKIGAETMDVLVRPMTDVEAMEETILENVREDLTPIEEAAAVGALLDLGRTQEEVADLMGKGLTWVAKRANLLSLSPIVAEKLEAGCGVDLTVGAMEVMARYDAEIQDSIFNDIQENEAPSDWEETGKSVKISEKAMVDYCADVHRDLTHVLWDLDDALLFPAAGACSACPKRSSCEPLLFSREELGEKAGVDLCLDDKCFGRKRAAFLRRVVSDAESKTGRAVVILTNHSDDREQLGDMNVGMKHEYEAAKKTDPRAVAAIDLSAKGAPKVKYVKPRDYAAGGSKELTKKTMAEKREELTKKRELYAVHQLREAFEVALLVDLVPIADVDTPAQILALSLSFGVSLHRWCYDMNELQDDNNVWIHPDDHLDAIDWLFEKHDRVLAAGWLAVRKAIVETLSRKGPVSQTHSAAYIEHAKGVAALIGWDWEKAINAAADVIPEPKSWSKETAEA